MTNEEYLKEYFTNNSDPTKNGYWRPMHLDGEFNDYDVIASEITADLVVLDVGCGYHPFKGKIKNLTGIDKYNSAADVVVDLLDFQQDPNFYDVVIALGSTNLHSFDLIEKQIDRLVYWCKPGGRIYMRVNPVLENIISPKMAVYPWTLNDIVYFTNKHNLKIIKPVTLSDNLRLTFTWVKEG